MCAGCSRQHRSRSSLRTVSNLLSLAGRPRELTPEAPIDYVADYENPISPEILRAVNSRVVAGDKNDHLLLPPEVEEAGQYETPLPREVTGIEVGLPPSNSFLRRAMLTRYCVADLYPGTPACAPPATTRPDRRVYVALCRSRAVVPPSFLQLHLMSALLTKCHVSGSCSSVWPRGPFPREAFLPPPSLERSTAERRQRRRSQSGGKRRPRMRASRSPVPLPLRLLAQNTSRSVLVLTVRSCMIPPLPSYPVP